MNGKEYYVPPERLQLSVIKFFNDFVKNGKKRDGSVVIWISHIPFSML